MSARCDELLGLARPADPQIDEGEVVEAHGELAPGAGGPFLDGDGAPVQRLGIVVAAETLVDAGEIVQADRDVAMVSPERILADHQRALVERLRLGVAAEEIVGHGEVVEAPGEADALVPPDGRFAERDGALAQLDRLDITAQEFVGAGEIAQGIDQIGTVLVRVLLQDRESAAVEVRRLVIAVLLDLRARLRHQGVRGDEVLRAGRAGGCEKKRDGQNGSGAGRHRAKHRGLPFRGDPRRAAPQCANSTCCGAACQRSGPRRTIMCFGSDRPAEVQSRPALSGRDLVPRPDRSAAGACIEACLRGDRCPASLRQCVRRRHDGGRSPGERSDTRGRRCDATQAPGFRCRSIRATAPAPRQKETAVPRDRGWPAARSGWQSSEVVAEPDPHRLDSSGAS